MKIQHGKYLLTAVKASQYPETLLPAVTFLGRSNVGKSSLINTLANNKNLARTSGQPGKTRTINFYDMDSIWYLVDLPGYGYAKAAKTERESWRRMIDEYMQRYAAPKLYLQLVDIRHEPSVLDVEMWRWLTASGVNCHLIATKADKISRGAREKHLAVIGKALQVPSKEIQPFSAVTKDGKAELLAEIGSFLSVYTKIKE